MTTRPTTRPATPRATRPLCALLLACAATLCACAGSQRAGSAGMQLDRNASIEKARQLATQAQAAQKQGNLDRAIDLYRSSVTTSPELGAVWNNMGIALMQRKHDNDFVAAAGAFQEAARLLPSDPTPHRNLGLLYQARGFEEDALAHFDHALELAPYDLDSLRGAAASGQVLRKSDHASLARLQRAQMVETDPAWIDIIKRERIRVENDLRESSGRL